MQYIENSPLTQLPQQQIELQKELCQARIRGGKWCQHLRLAGRNEEKGKNERNGKGKRKRIGGKNWEGSIKVLTITPESRKPTLLAPKDVMLNPCLNIGTVHGHIIFNTGMTGREMVLTPQRAYRRKELLILGNRKHDPVLNIAAIN
ncbi:unnamed protein product [Acanthoscelides obtectus]|uniref:Uncharacterized protein n=1 Tax=Acanthoscelides obtectus TaxID=200917 RepID=A0A9P0PCV4_ACAOB|nr:unnamed protein product [Acanthoscelides obtectus]CAK1628223.1 hypothetical protein AOBTE_LOCUS5082 [Acanthoscelides obtectus]